MAPDDEGKFAVISENGHECFMSADALGITACLYAYSHLSFGDDGFAETCAQQYHWLRECMFEHAEVRVGLAATDCGGGGAPNLSISCCVSINSKTNSDTHHQQYGDSMS
jgi:hypothetical protein